MKIATQKGKILETFCAYDCGDWWSDAYKIQNENGDILYLLAVCKDMSDTSRGLYCITESDYNWLKSDEADKSNWMQDVDKLYKRGNVLYFCGVKDAKNDTDIILFLGNASKWYWRYKLEVYYWCGVKKHYELLAEWYYTVSKGAYEDIREKRYNVNRYRLIKTKTDGSKQVIYIDKELEKDLNKRGITI